MKEFEEDTQKMLDSLREAVAETLERKRRLGHYVVICRDGKPMLIGDDAPIGWENPNTFSAERY